MACDSTYRNNLALAAMQSGKKTQGCLCDCKLLEKYRKLSSTTPSKKQGKATETHREKEVML